MNLQALAAARPAKPRTASAKFKTLYRQVINWYCLPLDKLVAGGNLVYRFRNGAEMECRRRSSDINEAVVVLSGIEYPAELCTLARDGAVVVDAGANIGSFGVFVHGLNRNRAYRLYAFEPCAANRELAERNFRRNGLSDYRLLPQALSGTNGTAYLDVSGAFDGHKLSDSTEGMEVETLTLSRFCRNERIDRIDLLKMDVEGAEFDIVGTDGAFIGAHVGVLMMEYHLSGQRRKADGLLAALAPHFDFITENTHVGGGMILAVNKNGRPKGTVPAEAVAKPENDGR